VDRIAATIRQHEREAGGRGRGVVEEPTGTKRQARLGRRRKSARRRDGAVGA
jgi:hypothetical protein